MNFLDLSDELLLQILTCSIELDVSLYHLVCVCKRLYAISLPLLYSNLTKPAAYLSDQTALNSLLQNIVRHPERKLWVKCGNFQWHDGTFGQKVIELVSSCSTMHTISIQLSLMRSPAYPTITETFQHSFERLGIGRLLEHPRYSELRPPVCEFFSRCTNTTLRSVTVKSPAVNAFDVISIYQLPNLEHLKVVNLAPKITLLSGITTRDLPTFGPTKIKKLEFFTRVEPDPYNVSYLLSRQPRLRRFTWASTGPLGRAYGFKSQAFLDMFYPVKGNVTKLFIGREHFGTDLTGYSELEILQTTKWILNEARREDLAERLPWKLRELEIAFPRRCHILHNSETETIDYSWIMALAESKLVGRNCLSKVRLVENHADEAPNIVEWEQPEKVKDAFASAGICLEVLLTRRVPMEGA